MTKTRNKMGRSGRALMMIAALAMFAASVLPTQVLAQKRKIIRDAEVEALLRDYTLPLFRAAGIPANAGEVVIVSSSRINAFVSSGQRVYVHTGLITEADTPNEVIGVLAHEIGHIAGGHHARSRDEIARASIGSVVSMIAGAAAIAGGVAAGNADVSKAAVGLMRSSQGAFQRNFLRYAREQESAADQAAIRFLDATGQSAKGMLRLFERLSDQMLVSVRNIDPYVQSHPLPRERINFLARTVSEGRYFNTPDPPELLLRHQLAQAKILAYLGRPSTVTRRYGAGDTGLPATYARAISYFRSGDIERSIVELDRLIAAMPGYPYFHEIKGQALLETGRARQAIPILQHAIKLAPNSPLIRILLAQAMISTGDDAYIEPAITQLLRAMQHEHRSSAGYRFLAIAYGRKGDTGRAELASANEYAVRGDISQARVFAKRAKEKLPRGSTEWQIADDIENIKRK
ncbi:MAG: M48 family metallopeptidase [Rhizobiales bacterium]|nr:M48 family metallopeptidase [Hyphomicrobiales bacterium]